MSPICDAAALEMPAALTLSLTLAQAPRTRLGLARRFLRRQMGLAALLVGAFALNACGSKPANPTDPGAPAAAPAAQPEPAQAPAPSATPRSAAPAAAPAAPATPAAAAAAPPPILPFDEAVQAAANTLLGRAQLPPDTKFDLVIDPLIDGVTGMQSQATRAMGTRIVKIIREGYPRYVVQPFNTDSVKRGPLLLVGTFTGVNAERKTEGKREAYRICLALADLKTGKLVSKGLAFAKPDGVDMAPLPVDRDAPAWLEDNTTLGYIRTCQGTRAGDAIHPAYINRVLTSAKLAEANDAYAAGKWTSARKLYDEALASEGGDQLRTHTGLYLSHWKLGNRKAAAQSLGRIVDQGLENKRLGMKFLFRPGTAALWSDPKAGASAYPLWLQEIAGRAARRSSCLELVGHTSASGPEPINEKLSLMRAEELKKQLGRLAPPLSQRMIAAGMGSRQTLIGTGRDDLSDVLDRRVEFKVVGC